MTKPTFQVVLPDRPRSDLISVITPLYVKGVEYLTEAYESLATQRIPEGMALEWVVQEDTATPGSYHLIGAFDSDDLHITYGFNGRNCGQAVTRNMAFQRSRGSFIYPLDQDDILAPDALVNLHAVLREHENVVWVTGKVERLFEDGHTEVRVDPMIEPGLLPAGYIFDPFEQHGITTAFYPTATMFRRTQLHLVGGWPAVVAAEDAELQLVMGTLYDGWRIDDVVLKRRKWSGQAVLADWYKGPDVEAIATRYDRARNIRHTI